MIYENPTYQSVSCHSGSKSMLLEVILAEGDRERGVGWPSRYHRHTTREDALLGRRIRVSGQSV